MNLYDKRTNQAIITSRVVRTYSEQSCDNCRQELPPCAEDKTKCNNISTALHLDSGYIIYLSYKELQHISKAYREARDRQYQPTELPAPLPDEEEPNLEEMEE